jgi:hypothetical protein
VCDVLFGFEKPLRLHYLRVGLFDSAAAKLPGIHAGFGLCKIALQGSEDINIQ